MYLIKTQFGNFGNHIDLLRFMKDEGISNVHFSSYYIFDKICSFDLTLADVENIVKNEAI